MKILAKILKNILAVALLAGAIFYFREDLNLAMENLYRKVSPCERPIVYSVGDLDNRFALAQDDLLKAVKEAAEIWQRPVAKELFSSAASGGLKINLLYDARQDSTLKLKNLGLTITKDKTTFETLKNKYDAFDKTYQKQKAELDNMVKYYEEQKANYEDEVKAANRRGGVTPDESAILEEERKSLNDLAGSIKLKQAETNKIVDDLNALANVINRLIYELNLNVKNYNNVGAASAGEFQEGEYISDAAGERINIYQFDDQSALVRVLAHELGHALGLEHVDNPQAIMYRLNESGNDQLAADDSAALKAACQIE